MPWWCKKIQIRVQIYSQIKSTQVQSTLSRYQKIQTNNTKRICWQFANKNAWMKVPLHFWNKTCSSPLISRLFPVTQKGSNVVVFVWYLRHTRLRRTTSWYRIYNEDSFCTLNSVTVGVPRSSVPWTVTKFLTSLAGNIRWRMLPWLLSVTSFPDDRYFDEQLPHNFYLTSPILAFWGTRFFSCFFWKEIYLKNILWQNVAVFHI